MSKTNPQSSPEAHSLRIQIIDPDVRQFMDYPDFTDDQRKQIFLFNFAKASIKEYGQGEIFNGQLILRINTTVSPSSLAIFQRVLHSFKGMLEVIVSGTYTINGTFIEIMAESVPWTHLNPSGTNPSEGLYLVPFKSD